MKRLTFTLLMLGFLGALFGQPVSDNVVRNYVTNYKDMAVQEMREFKVPASITLAQAIYSTKAGTNRVAREANNHFGIMCHTNEWVGDTFYETEDHSSDHCYRKYADVENSYRDHSLFLSRRPRYSFLFELPVTDYRSWARGLKEAGYSGNPRYADTLISIIEKYGLSQYDEVLPQVGKDQIKTTEQTAASTITPAPKAEPLQPITPTATITKDVVPKTIPRLVDNVNVFVLQNKDVPFKQAYHPNTKRPVYENNKTKFIIASYGDTYASLATSLQMTEKNLRTYNDVYDDSEPVEGEVVYLEIKSTRSPLEYHILEKNDTYHYLSQKYAVQLKILLKRNSGTLKNYKEGDKICIGCH